MSFNDLGLEPELLRAVADKGYTTPTPIQKQAIPAVLSGRDVLAGAQTGTGKTAGFVLPLLQKLGGVQGTAPRVLVLTPTRELAAQIAESARDYGVHKKLRTRVIFGGVGERPQIDGLRVGCDILIATPGRLLDLAERNLVDLSKVQHFVLDEADRMLDMGFIQPIRRISRMLPQQRQNLMFSATYSEDIRQLAEKMLRNPVQIEVASRNKTADRVEQIAYRVTKDQKRHLLVHLFENGTGTEGPGSRRWCSRAPSTARTVSPSNSTRPACAPRRSMATRARPRACGRSRTSRPDASARWWPPKSLRAASTSRNCRRS